MKSNKTRNFRYFKEASSDRQKHNSQHINNKHLTEKNIKNSKRTKTRTKSLKKQIHDTQRLLFKNILCEEGAKSQQLKLEQLRKSHSEETPNRCKSKKVKRYKDIKFFDSRKVLKKLNLLDIAIDKPELTDGLELALYKRYLNYITYYPEDRKYISLFPNSERLDPNAQAQLDALLQETNSRVEQGLYADAWTAHIAKTPTDIVRDSKSEISDAREVSVERTADLTSSPMFIPIDTNGSQSPKNEVKSLKKRTSKLSSPRDVDTSQPDHPTQVESINDNSIPEMECGEDLKCDSFFFFDTTGSKIDARLFKNRPQKRNFQDTRHPKQNSRHSTHNTRRSTHNTRRSDKKGGLS